ncbi:MAG: alpha/beta fold hydrolase [Aeromonadaceae bacterium]
MFARALLSLLFFLSLTGRALAMDNPYHLLTAAELPNFYQQLLPPFWQQHAQPGEFAGVGNLPIRYVALRNPQSHRAIVLVNGRIESYIKYQELAYELYQQGYSVYLYDHRGQGFSGRMLSDPHKGYIDHFSDYTADLKQFHDQIVMADHPSQLYLLAHSMGGTIALDYLSQYPDDFQAAVLCAPMLGIQLGAMPTWLAKFITWLMEWATLLLGLESPYAPTQGRYDPLPFAENELTQDPLRYAHFRQVYRDYPEVQLGGPTARWLNQALSATERTMTLAPRITTPLLLLQAGADTVVRNDRQDEFCQNMAAAQRNCDGNQPRVIAGAKHELLNETDEIRMQAISATLDFLKRNP